MRSNISGQTLLKRILIKRVAGRGWSLFLILKILTLSAVSDYVDHEVLTALVAFITSF